MALETINRLSVTYRVEAFSFLACNAWELLLKAKILETGGGRRAIYYKTKPHEGTRTISLRDSLKSVFPNEKDPVRRNIERVAEFRDAAAHLVIDTIPKNVMELFQSLILNYHRCLQEWFDTSLSSRVPVGMMTIVFDSMPDQFDPSNSLLRRRMGVETVEWLARYTKELREESAILGTPNEFMLTIRYSFAYAKMPADADVTIANASTGILAGILEVPKDPCRTHPNRQMDVIRLVNEALDGSYLVNQYDIQAIVRAHGIKKRSEFFYKGAIGGSFPQYSQGFVNWLIAQYRQDPECFKRLRRHYAPGAPVIVANA